MYECMFFSHRLTIGFYIPLIVLTTMSSLSESLGERQKTACTVAAISCANSDTYNRTTVSNHTFFYISDRWKYSELIRYEKPTGDLRHDKLIHVDREFLDIVSLLHNNENQLRTLLTIFRSDSAPPWVKFMRGYSQCLDHPIIYTCVEEKCQQYNLEELPYGKDIFLENVVGFDLGAPPHNMSVLIAVSNTKPKITKVLRITSTSLTLFDALYNTVLTFFRSIGARNVDVVRRLILYQASLSGPHRDAPIHNYLNRDLS
ncbi:GP115 [Caviid betaherpesvirus 2]|uniref:Envelope glycoprotein L n=1 Tax=Guinea pig cytomegalovirus (strain 22122) TaxID=103920 RepID=GL_GPCMV|nr:GP115 [Caviid betaherpesvirus 2]O92277.1 RecName: Full=Envelope glycoprotein L; Short=gL; Flags: Precursor [Guinea pig cytomegalovirus (strain 22122 / ATCC VR682) (GPCMV)]AGE11578.1 GP115 [Caviid betaherpesvirus 2]AIL83966.1 GP115 [BAC cloning vector GPN13BACdenovo_preserved(MM)]BAJ78566.1 GP115 [Caviid betaherpesvirus 2]